MARFFPSRNEWKDPMLFNCQSGVFTNRNLSRFNHFYAFPKFNFFTGPYSALIPSFQEPRIPNLGPNHSFFVSGLVQISSFFCLKWANDYMIGTGANTILAILQFFHNFAIDNSLMLLVNACMFLGWFWVKRRCVIDNPQKRNLGNSVAFF